MALKFDGSMVYPVGDTISFVGFDGNEQINCAVTDDALEEWARRRDFAYVDTTEIFWFCQPKLQKLVNNNHEDGRYAAPNFILITTEQLNP